MPAPGSNSAGLARSTRGHLGNAFKKAVSRYTYIICTGESAGKVMIFTTQFPDRSHPLFLKNFDGILKTGRSRGPMPFRTTTDTKKRAKKSNADYGGNMDSRLHRNLPEKCTFGPSLKCFSSSQKRNQKESFEFQSSQVFSPVNARKKIFFTSARQCRREKIFYAKDHGLF